MNRDTISWLCSATVFLSIIIGLSVWADKRIDHIDAMIKLNRQKCLVDTPENTAKGQKK